MAKGMTPPFVVMALKVCEIMGIMDKGGQGIVMRFCKMYSPEKIGRIVERAKNFSWWQRNPKAAFMRAVGIENKIEKANQNVN